MSKTSGAEGLCPACKFDPDCSYKASSRRAILQCEHFEMGLRKFPVQSEYLGLCSNCGNRETCTLPKPEGGIWRCEEYV